MAKLLQVMTVVDWQSGVGESYRGPVCRVHGVKPVTLIAPYIKTNLIKYLKGPSVYCQEIKIIAAVYVGPVQEKHFGIPLRVLQKPPRTFSSQSCTEILDNPSAWAKILRYVPCHNL